jgi:putative membrane protein
VGHPFHGVYTVGVDTKDLVERCRAVAPRLDSREYFSHATAARLWGIPLPRAYDPSDAIHVTALGMDDRTRPAGLKAFGQTKEQAESSKVLAANQGLYNGFLAAGLLFALYSGGHDGFHMKIFFLACVVVAGIFGGFTASRKIFFVQALPALIALIALHLV